LLCCSQSCVASIILPPHATGVLQVPASAFVTALLHFGGDRRPLMRDVHWCVAVNPPILAVLHAALGREGDEPD
jgi:hypothetical protein